MSDTEKKKVGRPASKQNLLSHPLAHSLIRELHDRGATNEECASRLLVSKRTWLRWKEANQEFWHSLSQKVQMDDEKVERSLLMLATGYEKDLPIYDPEGNLIEMRKVHVPPNAAAIQFYLKNRRSEKWRDKIDIAASMEQIPVRINFKRKEKVIDAEASIIPERKEIDGTQQRHTDIHEERESDVDIEE